VAEWRGSPERAGETPRVWNRVRKAVATGPPPPHPKPAAAGPAGRPQVRLKRGDPYGETLDELTYDYEDEGVLVRKQLEKVVLTRARGPR